MSLVFVLELKLSGAAGKWFVEDGTVYEFLASGDAVHVIPSRSHDRLKLDEESLKKALKAMKDKVKVYYDEKTFAAELKAIKTIVGNE